MRIICLIFTLAYAGAIFAAPETYIRSYRYQASETDSKLTARTAAISQVHHLLLSELGTYVNSRIDITKTDSGKGLSQQDITTLTAGFIKTEILDESWDGNEYYIQAKLIADPDEIARKLSDRRFVQQQLRKERSRTISEAQYWGSIRMSESVDMFRSYLEKYPDGKFKELALLYIKRINDKIAKEKMDAERRETESRMLMQVLNNLKGQGANVQQAVLLEQPGKILIVARHDTGYASKKSREEVAYLLADTLKKQLDNVIAKGTEIIILTDYDQTEDFLYDGQAGKRSKKFCADENFDYVIAATLEDHEGSKGYLRSVIFRLFNCGLSEETRHFYLPEFNKGGRYKREASIRKEFSKFVHDYIDAM